MCRCLALTTVLALLILVLVSPLAPTKAEAHQPPASPASPARMPGDADVALPAAAPVAAPAATPSFCIVDAHKWASPPVLLLGEPITVTLTVRVSCGDETFPLHLVLVLDQSTSMSGAPIQQLKQAAARLVSSLDLARNPATQIGVVGFSHQASPLCGLSNNENEVLGAISRLQANGNTRIDLGIVEGVATLRRGRNGLGRDELNEAMVVVSDGQNNAGPEPVLAAARQARAQGILVVAVCAGPGCDRATMRQVASAPRYYFEATNPGDLAGVFMEIQRRLLNTSIRTFQVKDVLSDNVDYIDGSARPLQTSPTRVDRWLVWEEAFVPRDGLTYTFAVVPRAVGYQPTNQVAQGSLRDSQGRIQEWVFDTPWVTVLQPRPLVTPEMPPPPPSSTSPPPTPSFTPTAWPTDPPTPTDTPPPTPVPRTPTPAPRALYLPIALSERCVPSRFYADVVLVMDVSTSMSRPTLSGRSKAEVAAAGAGALVDMLQLPPSEDGGHDRVAVVGYNAAAWIQQPLTESADAARAALQVIERRRAEGTRLDLAFAAGADAATAGPPIGNRRFMIVLTDGLPNRVPPAEDGAMATTVLRAASAAKNRGVGVFVIGVGRDDPAAPLIDQVDPWLLRQCATSPEMFVHEPDADRLAEVYHRIYVEINPCLGRHAWGDPHWPPTVEPPTQ